LIGRTHTEIVLDGGEHLPIRRATSDDARCGMCVEDLGEGEAITVLPCGHVFHVDCVVEPLNDKAQCPLCFSWL
jgi:hypothetical protein